MRLRLAGLVFCCAAGVPAAQASAFEPMQRPEIVPSTGHGGHVMQVAAASDGTFLVTSGADRTLRIWSLDTLRDIRSFSENDVIFDFALSPDNQWLAAAVGNQVSIWEIAAGTNRARLGRSDGPKVTALAISPDGRTIASAAGRSIRLWNAATGQLVRELATAAELISLAFSPDGRRLAGGGVKELAIWPLDAGPPTALVGHTAGVHAVAYSRDGQMLASGSWDGSVRLWTSSGSPIRTIPGVGAVTSLAFSPSGSMLAAGTTVPNLSLWDPKTGTKLRTITVEGAPETRALDLETKAETYDSVAKQYALFTAFADTAPEGGRLRAPRGGYRSSVLFPFSERLLLSTIDPLFARVWFADSGAPGQVLWGMRQSIEGAVFSADGRWMLCSAGGGSAALWDLRSGTQVRVQPGPRLTPLGFDPQGRLMATVEEDGHRVVIRETESGRQIAAVPTHIDDGNSGPNAVRIAVVALSPDFRIVASASGAGARRVRVWNAADGRRLLDLEGHEAFVTGLHFSPDGALLASSGNDGKIRLWDMRSGAALHTFDAWPFTAPVFSADSRRLAYVDEEDTLHVVDAKTGGSMVRRKFDGSPDFLAFHPHGQILAARFRRTVVLLDAASGATIRENTAANQTADMQFTHDGRWLMTSDSDGAMRFFDPATLDVSIVLLAIEKNTETYEDDDSWLVVTPEGLFDGPPQAWRKVNLRFNGQTFDISPVEIGFKAYYSPGLLADVLSGQRPKPAEDISRVDRRQVDVAFVSPDPGGAMPAASGPIKIRLRVTEAKADARHPRGSGARDVRLFRNGSLVKRWRGDLQLDAAGAALLDVDVPVVAGENEFVAYAFTRSDIKSADASLTIKGSDTLRRPATAHIVAVGVNRYATAGLDLRYAVPDARDFAGELARRLTELKSFGSVRVVSLLDGDATAANIRAALARLGGRPVTLSARQQSLFAGIERAAPEDSVFIYFAGHGIAVADSFYLLPHDFAVSANRTVDPALVVSQEDLGALIEEIDVTRVVLVIDACQSGQVLEAEERRTGPMNSRGFAQLAYEKGMYVLTASQAHQAALEVSQLGHGLLTYTLIEEGLKTAKAGRGGQVDVRSWLDFAVARVPELEAEMRVQKNAAGRALAAVGDSRALQRPRVFYRREPEVRPLILAVFR